MSLGLAAAHCERFFGAGWYFNPARWDTVDGYAPWSVVWIAWRSLQSIAAWERLSMQRAIALSLSSGDAGARQRLEEMAIAYPVEESG